MKRLQGIRKFLQKVRSASGQELSAEFSLSLRRLRDHLRALECLTSYSHKRSFYALPATARFDKHRIWKCRRNGALFTDLGSLGALVEWHVRQSPSGLTCRELSQIVGVRVEPQSVRISREHGLIRQKFDGEFVYFCRANEKVYRVQVGKRGRCSRSTGAGPARVVDSEVDELQRDLQIALALLNHPRRAVAVTVDTLRRKGVNVSTRDVTEVLVRYDVKKKHVSLEVIQLDLLFAATRLQAALSSRNASRAIYCLLLESSTTHCPRCGNLLCVIKTTTPRSIKSIRFGLFWVKERLKACQACGDARVWRSEVLPLVVPSRRTVAYDVMVFAGEQKLLRSHTLEAIQKSLAADYELSVSLSLLSLYVQEFCYRFECLHFAKLAKLARWTKKQQLGYMLHVDCSSERKSDTVFVAYDRTSEIVLISEKVPSERMPFLVPVLKKVKAYMGNPISAMSDLGLPIMKSIEEAFPGVQRRICHFHLLRDVGKDILDPDYADLRAQINQSKINAKLNALERDVLSTHSAIDASRISAKEPLLRSCGREE